MANSRRSRPAERGARTKTPGAAHEAADRRDDGADDPAQGAILAAAARAIAEVHAAGGTRIAVALSGGRDSMTLLDALAQLAPATHIALGAVHVHHGLSRNADRWAAFCEGECRRRGIACEVRRVHVARASGKGLESAARTARYAALASVDADAVALAHHADDQAETLLLQLLRGAGPPGLAGMPARRSGTPMVVRPLLAIRRTTIERYAQLRSLAFVDDESNADPGFARNFLRREVGVRLAAQFPGYPDTLVRAARHQAEAAALLEELAAQDAGDDAMPGSLDRARLAALSPSRARNLLRWFLRRNALAAPTAARLSAMLRQLCRAAPDSRIRLAHDGVEIGIHRGRILIHAPAPGAFEARWCGEPTLRLPHGTLRFTPARGEGFAADMLTRDAMTVRAREGGERMRVAAERPRQALSTLWQSAGVPAWDRAGIPLLFCGNALVAVPDIGVEAAFQAAAGAKGFVLGWEPASATARAI